MRNLYIVLIFLFSQSLLSQTNGSIVGKLTDKEVNNEPLAFANVLLKGTTKGTTSDFDGLYEISNVAPGSYTVVFTFLGYETLEIPDVIVEAGKVTEVNAALGAGSVSLDEVVITTTVAKESEAALLLDQKKAVQIKESIGAEALTKKGIDDAAAAVAQISGISKQQGSSDVYVRGLGDRYQNTTMNGLSLPSNDVNKKNINLDLFSSSIIENIAVSKAYTPLFYGDFSAGNVNIDSKEYTGNGYVDIALGSGLNSNAAGTDFVTSEGTSFFGFYNRYDNDPFAVILSHGVDPDQAPDPVNISGSIEGGYSVNLSDESRLSFFGMASFSNGYQFLEGPALDFTNDIKVRFPLVNEYAYNTTTTAMGAISYRINSDHKLKYTSLFINSARDAVGYYGIGGNGFNRDGFSNNGDGGYFQLNVQFNQDMIFVNQLNGEHTFDEDWKLDWGIGFNKVLSDEPDRKRISLEDYQFALDDDPNTNPIFYDNIAFDNQRYFQSIEDDELNSFINLSRKVSDKVTLNFGYNGRRKERRFNNWRYGYLIADKNANPVTDVNNFNDFFDVSNINLPAGSGLWDLFIVRNPGNENIGLINRPQAYENIYQGNLDIHGVYATAELNLSDKWLLIPGFRVESYNQRIAYDVINPVPTDPGFRNAYENIYLPSLNVRYALNEDANLRFSFSKTASFPEFKEAANFVYEGVVQRVGGNPDLLGKPDGTGPIYSEIFNYDLKYEWFPNRGELISVAAFAKAINDPVNRVVATDATGNQRYFRTGDQAKVYGVEIEVRKNILTDENDNGILSFGANAAYTHTEQDLKTVSTADGFTFGTSFANRTSEELEGASPIIINADINYSPEFENYKPAASLAFSYFSDRIYAIGSGNLGNMVEKAVPTMNFVWRNAFGEHFEANLSVQNILNPNISLVRENTGVEENNPLVRGFVRDGDVILREFKRGINAGLTLKYKF
ncbi:TonB-dependent receptor [Muriicola marianensis]|uniref:TonB-dependent receptor n=1 Tax=Muriicola marianensis TaxID=1324801 RepID=UPI0016628CE9|nr:TonB-dependent receptor [Muriicola marianensis]